MNSFWDLHLQIVESCKQKLLIEFSRLLFSRKGCSFRILLFLHFLFWIFEISYNRNTPILFNTRDRKKNSDLQHCTKYIEMSLRSLLPFWSLFFSFCSLVENLSTKIYQVQVFICVLRAFDYNKLCLEWLVSLRFLSYNSSNFETRGSQ